MAVKSAGVGMDSEKRDGHESVTESTESCGSRGSVNNITSRSKSSYHVRRQGGLRRRTVVGEVMGRVQSRIILSCEGNEVNCSPTAWRLRRAVMCYLSGRHSH